MSRLGGIVGLIVLLVLVCAAAFAAPSTPVVLDDGVTTPHAHRLHASWSATDPAGVSRYEYAVGFAPYPQPGWDAVTGGWRNAGAAAQTTVTDVLLSLVRSYYFSVRAYNASSQVSPVGVSDGIRLTPPSAGVFTTSADFEMGELTSLVSNPPDQLQLGAVSQTEPYIWIANHTIGRVTKIDTRTGVILAQYYSTRDPSQVLPDNMAGQIPIPPQGSNLQSPSRTAVDLDGNVFVANRAHVASGQQSSLTKIAGSRAFAVDRNGSGMIETSSGYGDVLADDEMVIWTVKVGKPGMIARGVAVDSENNVWVGTFNDAVLYRFNGETGALIDSIDLKAETGKSDIQIYGVAIGRDGALYTASLDSNWACRVDPKAPKGSRVRAVRTSFQGYGLAVDRNGVQWIGRWGGSGETNLQMVDWRFDPPVVGYRSSPSGGRTRGVAVDGTGAIWTANYDANALLKFSPEGNYLGSYAVASGPIGVAVDSEGRIWAVGNTSNLCTRIDPVTGERADYSAGGEPYSYSDMTGFQLRNYTARQGYWTLVCDGGGYGARWRGISWNASQPAGTLLKVDARWAESTDGLEASAWHQVTSGEELAGATGRLLEVRATFRVISGDVSPVLYDLTVDVPESGGAPPDMSIPEAKLAADQTSGKLVESVVSFAGPGFFYMQQPDRAIGIRVQSEEQVSPGDRVRVIGRAVTVADERRILDGVLSSAALGEPPAPVAVRSTELGGPAFGGQPGTTSNPGVNNTGLYVALEGRLVSEDTEYVYLDDGAMSGGGGVRVRKGAPVNGLVVGDRAFIGGASSVVETQDGLQAVLLPDAAGSAFGSDEFNDSVLAPYWTLIRPDANYWSLTTNPGFLRIDATNTDIYGSNNTTKNLLVRPMPPGMDWSVETLVSGTPTRNYSQGGVLVYQNDDNYLRYEFGFVSGALRTEYVREVAGGTQVGSTGALTGVTAVNLRIDRVGSTYSLWWKQPADTTWNKLADLPNLPFTNVQAGLFAHAGNSPFDPFLFDYFRWWSH